MRNWRRYILEIIGFPKGLEEFKMNWFQKLVFFLLCKTMPKNSIWYKYNPFIKK